MSIYTLLCIPSSCYGWRFHSLIIWLLSHIRISPLKKIKSWGLHEYCSVQTHTCSRSGGSNNLPWLVHDNIRIINNRTGSALLHMDWSGSWGSRQWRWTWGWYRGTFINKKEKQNKLNKIDIFSPSKRMLKKMEEGQGHQYKGDKLGEEDGPVSFRCWEQQQLRPGVSAFYSLHPYPWTSSSRQPVRNRYGGPTPDLPNISTKQYFNKIPQQAH